MPRPGTDIRLVDDAPRGGAILDTGQAFFAGLANRGSASKAVEVTSLPDYERKYGERAGATLLYDSVSAYFDEGGGVLYVSRVLAADAVAATGDLGTSLKATASSPGTWGNGVKLTSHDQGSGYYLAVELDGEQVDRSPTLMTQDDAVAWAQGRDYVTLVKGTGTDPPADAATVTLAGGTAGAAPDLDDLKAALDRFDYALGPGQVCLPGYTSQDAHEALLSHADRFRRCVLLDLADSADPLALTAEVEALADVQGVRFAQALAPWLVYPTDPPPFTLTIPPSGVQAAVIARADRTGNPNQPAAGDNGVHLRTEALSQDFTDDQREQMNTAGVTLCKLKYGAVRTYGGRTAAGPLETNWNWFGNSRVVMAIAHECDAVAEHYVLRQIDGQRQIFAALETDLRGVLLPHYNAGALYGEEPQEAFDVNVGPQVNTTDTIARGEIHAVVRVKCSPAAEWVQIDIVKVRVEVPLAA